MEQKAGEEIATRVLAGDNPGKVKGDKTVEVWEDPRCSETKVDQALRHSMRGEGPGPAEGLNHVQDNKAVL